MAEPYRSEENVLAEKLKHVEEELSHIDRVAARRETLAGEAAELKKRLKAARARTLEDLRIASPCSARWEDMAGDDRVRHCGGCKKDVFNVSGMTRAEAVDLVKSRSGQELCLRLYRRADGTILTADCAVGAKRKRVRRLVMVGAGVAAGVAGSLWAWSDSPTVTMGEAEYEVTGKRTAHTMGTATAMAQPPTVGSVSVPTHSAAPQVKPPR